MLAGLPDSLFAQTSSNASLPLSQAQLQQLGEEFSRAHRLQDQGDERAALAIYQKINQAQPKLVEPYINMASITNSGGTFNQYAYGTNATSRATMTGNAFLTPHTVKDAVESLVTSINSDVSRNLRDW